MSRYVVTGCAGFIGSHLTEALLDRGHTVVGIDRFTSFYPRPLKERNLERARSDPRFTLLERDLADPRWTGVLEGADGVFHLAAQAGVRDSWGASFSAYARDNLIATQRVFEAAATAGVRVVFASSSSVYGDAESYPTREDATPRPLSPYGVTKLGCEHLAHAYSSAAGLDVVSLRYFSVYGPRQRPDMAFSRIAQALLEQRPFTLLGAGDQIRDFTYVGDVVEASIAAMDTAPTATVYNVGGGTPISLRDAIALCERLTGRTLLCRRRPAARGDANHTMADIRRIRTAIAWQPRTALAEGLEAQLRWCSEVSANAAPRVDASVVPADRSMQGTAATA